MKKYITFFFSFLMLLLFYCFRGPIAAGWIIEYTPSSGACWCIGFRDWDRDGSFGDVESKIVGTDVTSSPACSDFCANVLPSPSYSALPGTDCDDLNASVHPGASELCGDSVDNNCDGSVDEGCSPVVSFAAHSFSVAEGTSPCEIVLTRSVVTSTSCSVTLTVTAGTATGGNTDYADGMFPLTLTFAAGETSKTVNVEITNDTIYETTTAETITFRIDSPVDATLGTQTTATLSIVDDDSQPTVTLGLSDSPFAENSGNSTVTATLSNTSVENVTVNLSFDGTATGSGLDYTASGNSITISAGNSSDSITLTSIDDAIDDGDETVIVDIDSVTNGSEDGIQQVTATITDDDTAGATVSPTSGLTVSEPNTTTTFTITLDTEPASDVTVGLSTPSGQCTASASGNLTSSNYETGVTITVTAADDNMDDGDQTCTVETSFTGDAVYAAINPDDVTVSVQDDDTAGITVVTPTDATEGGATGSYTVSLDTTPTSGNVTISVTSADTSQCTVSPSSLTLNSGMMSGTVTVTVTDDTTPEGNHSCTINHAVTSGPTEYPTSMTVADATVNLVDNDPGVMVNPTSVSITEDGVTDSYAMRLSTAPASAVTVSISPDVQTTVSPSSLTFTSANWDTAQTVTVGAADDSLYEGTHSGTISHGISTGDGAGYTASMSIASVSASITDNDEGLVINEIDIDQGDTDTTEFIEITNISSSSVDLGGYVLELIDDNSGATNAYSTINLTGGFLNPGEFYVICNSAADVPNCDQATNMGDDFIQDGSPDAMVLKKGAVISDMVSYGGDTSGYVETSGATADSTTEAFVSLSRDSDGTDTNDNSADFSLRCATPGLPNNVSDSTGCYQMAINDVTVTEGDSGTVSAQFSVSLSHVFSSGITVNYATAEDTATSDTDFTGTSGMLTFASAGSQNIIVSVTGDNLDENSERFYLYLSNPSYANITDSQGTGTITDDDNSPVATDDVYNTDEDTTLNDSVLTNDTDADTEDTLKAVKVSGPENGSLTLNENGSFTFTPNSNWSGTDSFTYKANDGYNDSGTATVTITVNPVNDAPYIKTPIANVTVSEDASVTTIDLTDVFGDIDNNDWEISKSFVSNSNAGLVTATVSGNTLSLSYAANQSGTADITIRGTSAGQTIDDTFTVTVNADNDAPYISDIPNQSTDDTVTTGTLAFTIGDMETPVADLILSPTSSDTELVPVSNILFGGSGENRTIMITPTPDMAGTATITVTVTDEDGKTGSDSFMLTITTGPGMENATMSAALQNDADGNGAVSPGDTIRYAIVLSNTGDRNAEGIMLTCPIPSDTELTGTVSAAGGTVISTDPVISIMNISVPTNGKANFFFDVIVSDGVMVGDMISAQATLAYDTDGDGISDADRQTDGDTDAEGIQPTEVIIGVIHEACELGDVNGDTDTDLKDAVIVLKILSGMRDSSAICLSADTNGDNKIGSEELLYILRNIAGM